MIDRLSVDQHWAKYISSAMGTNASEPNPYQSVLAAHAMQVVFRSSDDEPSISVEEQRVTAAMSRSNRIAPDNCKALLSSDTLSGLMALKRVCAYSDLAA